MFVEQGLGKNMVDLQAVQLAEQVTGKFDAAVPVFSFANAGEHIQQRVEAGTHAPALKVTGLYPQIAPSSP